MVLFQSVGNGNYYLITNCIYFCCGLEQPVVCIFIDNNFFNRSKPIIQIYAQPVQYNNLENMYIWDHQPEIWYTSREFPIIFPYQNFPTHNPPFSPDIFSPFLTNSEPRIQLIPNNYQQQSVIPEVYNPQITSRLEKKPTANRKPIKVSRNIKSLIIKDFLKFLRKDASKILEIKEQLNSNYSMKKFLQKLNFMIPMEKQKYIKVKLLVSICLDNSDPEFSQILRICIHNFLETDFPVQVLNKKKNKGEYLKGRRELYEKIFKRS